MIVAEKSTTTLGDLPDWSVLLKYNNTVTSREHHYNLRVEESIGDRWIPLKTG